LPEDSFDELPRARILFENIPMAVNSYETRGLPTPPSHILLAEFFEQSLHIRIPNIEKGILQPALKDYNVETFEFFKCHIINAYYFTMLPATIRLDLYKDFHCTFNERFPDSQILICCTFRVAIAVDPEC
jgi:hypothetical protein